MSSYSNGDRVTTRKCTTKIFIHRRKHIGKREGKNKFLFLFTSSIAVAQYTDQLNSNRPGASIGAFSVGKNVFQSELGFAYC